MPCELIDDKMVTILKEVLLQIGWRKRPRRGAGFAEYLDKACHYTLLVGPIGSFRVSPKDEFPALCQEFGYVDNSNGERRNTSIFMS